MVAAATPLPVELTGIWTSSGSEMKGQVVLTGNAIYLDSDGIGAMVGGNGSDVLGVRIVVSTYDSATHTIKIDVTEKGKVVMAGATLNYDPLEKTITSPLDHNRIYHREFLEVSDMTRKSLGLEPRSN